MTKILFIVAMCIILLSLNACASLSQFAGTWTNIDPNMRGIPTLDISVSGNSVRVHSWGSCTPTPCDWGTVDAYVFAPDVSSDISSTARALMAVFDFGFSVTTLIIKPSGQNLMVDSYHIFTDNGSRANYVNQYLFQRENPQGQLTAPIQVSPASGSVFNYFPRTTTLEWMPVAGASSYTVEIDPFDSVNSKWYNDEGQVSEVVPGIYSTNYTFDFLGAQPGRWRVWAVDASNNTGLKSGWWDFTYTT